MSLIDIDNRKPMFRVADYVCANESKLSKLQVDSSYINDLMKKNKYDCDTAEDLTRGIYVMSSYNNISDTAVELYDDISSIFYDYNHNRYKNPYNVFSYDKVIQLHPNYPLRNIYGEIIEETQEIPSDEIMIPEYYYSSPFDINENTIRILKKYNKFFIVKPGTALYNVVLMKKLLV